VDLFATDTSRWVKAALHQSLGEVIYNCGPKVSTSVTSYFLSLASSTGFAGDSTGDSVMQCAFSIPAVIATLGPAGWNTICPAYMLLTKDVSWKVRRTVALSICHVAKALNADIIVSDLFPVFDSFCRDIDEVKNAAVKQLHRFIELTPEAARRSHLSILSELSSEADNWRCRESVGLQLPDMVALFDAEVVEFDVIPIMLRLLKDPFSAVRLACAGQVGAVVKRLQAADNSDALQLLQNEIVALARDTSFNLRIVAAAAAHSAAAAGLLQYFRDHCLPFLLVIKTDKVCCAAAEVRLLAASCLMVVRCAMCDCVRLGCLRCFCGWASRGAVLLECSPVSPN
jgi:serine/threonine-protein phosphatase 4 regulatory subunit 1